MNTADVPLQRSERPREASVRFRVDVLLETIRLAREALLRDGKVSPRLWVALDRALDAMIDAL